MLAAVSKDRVALNQWLDAESDVATGFSKQP